MVSRQAIRRRLTNGHEELGCLTARQVADFEGHSDAYKVARRLKANNVTMIGNRYFVDDVITYEMSRMH